MSEDDDYRRRTIVCPHCAGENHPNAVLCRHCQGPMISAASTDPLRSISARGDVFSRAASRPQSRVVLIGMWVLFGSLILWFLSCLRPWMAIPNGAWTMKHVYTLLAALGFTALLCALPVAILWRTTRNYLRYQRQVAEEEKREAQKRARRRERAEAGTPDA